MAKPVKILSIDGGGIRGIIPALLLSEIERQTQRPIAELFDLIAGTSTGGILALGLVKPGADGKPNYRAEQLVALYEKEGGRIFPQTVWQRIRSAGGLAVEKYPADGLEAVLQEYLGEARLQEALAEVLITSYEIERHTPWYFKRRLARDPRQPEQDFLLREVARATSAAPTYFEPARLETNGRAGYYALIDGGVFVNNPAMCAYVEARSTHPKADDFLLVSLGTGELTQPLLYEEVKNWGKGRWVKPILSIVFGAVSNTVDHQLRQLLPPKNGARRYYRFQARLTEASEDMDDASPTNLRLIRLLGESIIAEHRETLRELCAQLIR